jgi:hypothetical protein
MGIPLGVAARAVPPVAEHPGHAPLTVPEGIDTDDPIRAEGDLCTRQGQAGPAHEPGEGPLEPRMTERAVQDAPKGASSFATATARSGNAHLSG